ncbi:MFS transporter [Solwaraspora sp. WMMA2065]|uniref:MFS transporter n=1 Tax=Solwaraspora sp. WMMA2065 TaxID=3015166 RepID=UPI00259AFB4D|nr:MFS transporter [Solwaraspora sp. WMMA2065]WJK35662.1 MFS transporter [Solwaraspora sp. WMMA2065]
MAAPATPRAAAGNRPWSALRRGSFTRAQWAVLIGGFLVNVGSFSIYPYLAVLLRERMGVGMAQVGVVLGAATLVQFASAPATAAVAERVGLKRALVAALTLYSLGGAAFLAGQRFPVLTVAGLLLISGGGSLYSPAYRSYLVHEVGDEQRPRLVSAGNAAGNLGIAVGPVVGALFVHRPTVMFAAVTTVYAGVALGHVFLRRERQVADAPPVEPFRRMLHGVAVLPFVVTAVSFYVHMQFYQYLSSYAQGRMATLLFGAANDGLFARPGGGAAPGRRAGGEDELPGGDGHRIRCPGDRDGRVRGWQRSGGGLRGRRDQRRQRRVVPQERPRSVGGVEKVGDGGLRPATARGGGRFVPQWRRRGQRVRGVRTSRVPTRLLAGRRRPVCHPSGAGAHCRAMAGTPRTAAGFLAALIRPSRAGLLRAGLFLGRR